MVTLEEVENTILTHQDPVVSVSDVMESLEVDCSDTHIRQQMRALKASGTLESKSVGSRAIAWWHVDRVTGPDIDTRETSGEQTDSTIEPEQDAHSGVEDDWIDRLETAPSSSRDEFETAARAVVDLIQEKGALSRSQAVEQLHESYPAGYENSRTWWRRVARPTLDAHPDCEPPPEGGSDWQYEKN